MSKEIGCSENVATNHVRAGTGKKRHYYKTLTLDVFMISNVGIGISKGISLKR
jgi:hypothetical protein